MEEKKFSYNGNENETYSLFYKGKFIGELFCGEHDANEIVFRLNQSNGLDELDYTDADGSNQLPIRKIEK